MTSCMWLSHRTSPANVSLNDRSTAWAFRGQDERVFSWQFGEDKRSASEAALTWDYCSTSLDEQLQSLLPTKQSLWNVLNICAYIHQKTNTKTNSESFWDSCGSTFCQIMATSNCKLLPHSSTEINWHSDRREYQHHMNLHPITIKCTHSFSLFFCYWAGKWFHFFWLNCLVIFKSLLDSEIKHYSW